VKSIPPGGPEHGGGGHVILICPELAVLFSSSSKNKYVIPEVKVRICVSEGLKLSFT